MQNTVRTAEKALSNADSVLAKLIERHGPCTLFEENSLVHKTPYHVLVWAIINQQLSVASASSIERKLKALLQNEDYEVNAIDVCTDQALSACGLSRQKIRYLRALSTAVIEEEIQLHKFDQLGNDDIANILTTIPGIGPWTVDMFLMFSLGRLDVLPLGDLALRKSIALHYELPADASFEAYHQVANLWRPYRTISSWYLWAAVD